MRVIIVHRWIAATPRARTYELGTTISEDRIAQFNCVPLLYEPVPTFRSWGKQI